MELFHIIEDAKVIVRQNGIFKQLKVYRRSDEVFAGVGAGFVKLLQRGGTTVPSITWLDIDAKDVVICEPGTLRASSPIYQPEEEKKK